MSLSKFACALGAVSMLAACQTTMEDNPKETIGTILGAAAGAVIGSNIGKGKGGTVGVALGTLAGAWLGSSIGRSMDELDKMKMENATQDALENKAVGETSSWSNPDSGNSGGITPTKTIYETARSEPCRDYTSTVTIDGQLETITGTACRRPDGTWRTVD
ncbi:17 kDa surface antigen [Candidatus Terasakiella magnetica]|uniref:17 kDa surface antigen n=1 Tax=Candidatus Terasakiella magnetica TaxID=1867952 RepID=A0A1C3RKC9_9PROT|nr:RT0821/Lpp0805 family surface protein [Candidatus Terasakiella magnetica]SCA57695.1 17 kDa surface antigen [Candidatus Terasakiella magnetica]